MPSDQITHMDSHVGLHMDSEFNYIRSPKYFVLVVTYHYYSVMLSPSCLYIFFE